MSDLTFPNAPLGHDLEHGSLRDPARDPSWAGPLHQRGVTGTQSPSAGPRQCPWKLGGGWGVGSERAGLQFLSLRVWVSFHTVIVSR